MKKENCEKTGTKFQINDKEEIEYVSWDEYNREIVEGKLTGVDFQIIRRGIHEELDFNVKRGAF